MMRTEAPAFPRQTVSEPWRADERCHRVSESCGRGVSGHSTAQRRIAMRAVECGRCAASVGL